MTQLGPGFTRARSRPQRMEVDAVSVADAFEGSSGPIRTSTLFNAAYRWSPSSSRGVQIGGFVGIRLPRPDTAATRGHTCVLRHSRCMLPQSVARGVRKLVGMLVCAGVVSARRRLGGEVVALLSPARDVAA